MGSLAQDFTVLRWVGNSSPTSWEPEDIYTTSHNKVTGQSGLHVPGCDWVPTYEGGRFEAFTTTFRHPPDRRPSKPDPSLVEQFEADNRARPLAHYQEGNQVHTAVSSRALYASEEEVLHGLPRNYTKFLRPPLSTNSTGSKRRLWICRMMLSAGVPLETVFTSPLLHCFSFFFCCRVDMLMWFVVGVILIAKCCPLQIWQRL